MNSVNTHGFAARIPRRTPTEVPNVTYRYRSRGRYNIIMLFPAAGTLCLSVHVLQHSNASEAFAGPTAPERKTARPTDTRQHKTGNLLLHTVQFCEKYF